MIAESILLEALEEVAGANGSRRGVIEKWAEILGVNVKTLYRQLKRAGLRTGRRERRDKGIVRGVTEEQLRQVVSLIYETWTEKDRIPMPAWVAIKQAEDLGIITKDSLSDAALNRWMRDNDISKRAALAPTPHVEMRSLHPNHVQEFDSSVCAQWHLREDGKIKHQRRGMEVYKNKPGKGPVIKRHVLIDHYSGAFFVGYSMSEDAAACLEFLFEGWKNKTKLGGQTRPLERPVSDPGFIFRGVPKILYCDNGNMVRSAVGKQVCERLGVELKTHMPGNPRAKGTVENWMWKWEQCFESQLRRDPAGSLEELNKRAFEFALWMNLNRKHTRHGMTRFECWAKIGTEELREIPEDRELLRSLAMRASEERSISYKGDILWDGNVYKVPDQLLWGKKCLVGPDVFSVGKNRTNGTNGTYDIIVECEGTRFVLGALKKDAGGFTEDAVTWGEYKRAKDTVTEKRVKELAKIKLPEECKTKNIKWETENIVPDVHGTKLDLEKQAAERVFTRVGAKGEIIRRLGYAPLKWQREIIGNFTKEGTEITEKKIEEIMERLESRAEVG